MASGWWWTCMWSAGTTTSESTPSRRALLTGTTPYTETSFAKLCAEFGKGTLPKPPRFHRPDLPAELDAAVMLCLQPDLEKRIPNVAALAGSSSTSTTPSFTETRTTPAVPIAPDASGASAAPSSPPTSW